ncbi:hypothetical protein BG004_001237 [Podila humilis]|nr:hypothetical protein BG004_001237 [Podila humilis]
MWILEEYGYFTFHPGDMVACLRVCRMWREAFTPHFWKVFDDTVMVCESSILSTTRDPKSGEYEYTAVGDGYIASDVRVVPLKTLCIYSHLIRYARLHISLPKGAFLSTKLKHLDIHSHVVQSDPNIILMSPSISKLKLAMVKAADYDCVQSALESLSNLTELEIRDYDFSQKNELVTVLNNNPGLRTLEITTKQGVPTFKTCNTLPKVSKIYMGSSFLVDDSQATSLALIELIRRCPGLEIFEIAGDAYNMSAIGPVIMKMCPKVHSVTWSGSHDVGDEELIGLMRSAHALRSIKFEPRRFSSELCEVVLEHATTLEDLDVSISYNVQDFAKRTNKILSSCPQLRNLSLKLWRTHLGAREHVDLDWLKGSWNCPKLESIDLYGFVDPEGYAGAEVYKVLGPAHESKLHFRHMPENKFNATAATRGWEISQAWSAEDDFVTLAVTLAFEQLWDFQYLKQVRVEGMEYTREVDKN